MKYLLDLPMVFPGGVERRFDLFVPEGDPVSIPLLIWVHGGAWSGGETRIGNEFERFMFRGCAVLSIDYRYIQEAPYPAQLIDCKSAVRWARAHANEYGYNADRILVGGNSAGGHLVSMLAVTNGMQEYDQGEYLNVSSDVQAVVDFYGPVDLRQGQLPELDKLFPVMFQGDDALAEAASPLLRITGKEPPFLILHGDADPTVPVEQSRRFHQALLDAGVSSRYVEVPGGVHGFDCLEVYTALNEFITDNT